MDRRQNLGENNSQYCTADSDVARGLGDPSERRSWTQNTDVVYGGVLSSQTNHSITYTPNTAIDTRGERPVESTAPVAFSDPAEIVNPGTPPFSDNFPAFIASTELDSLVHSLDDEKYAPPRLSQNTSYYQSQNNNYASDNILFYNNNNNINEYIYTHAVVQWSNNPYGYSDTSADNRIFEYPWNGQYPPNSSAQLWTFQQLQQHAGGQSQTNPPASVVQQYRDNGSSKTDVIGNYYPSAYVPGQFATTATSTAVLSGPTGPAAAGYHGPQESSSADDTDVMLSVQQYSLPVLEGEELDDLLDERTDGCRRPSEAPSEMSRSNRNDANLHGITWSDRPPAAQYPSMVGQTDFDWGSQQQQQQSRRFDNSSPRTPTATLTAAHRVNAMDDGVGGSSSSGPNPTNDNGADNRLRTTDVGLSPALHQLAKETDPKSSVPSPPLAVDGATDHGRLAVQHLLPSQMVVEDPPTVVDGNVSLPPPPPAGRPIIGGEASAAPVTVATTSAPILSWSLSNFVPTPIASTGKRSTSARPNRVNNRSAKANRTVNRLGAQPSNPVIKRLKCKVCPQSFSYPHEFKLHKKVHTGVSKLYTCLKCGKPFVERFLLEAHDFTIH